MSRRARMAAGRSASAWLSGSLTSFNRNMDGFLRGRCLGAMIVGPARRRAAPDRPVKPRILPAMAANCSCSGYARPLKHRMLNIRRWGGVGEILSSAARRRLAFRHLFPRRRDKPELFNMAGFLFYLFIPGIFKLQNWNGHL